jgi:hypothetical protein
LSNSFVLKDGKDSARRFLNQKFFCASPDFPVFLTPAAEMALFTKSDTDKQPRFYYFCTLVRHRSARFQNNTGSAAKTGRSPQGSELTL